MQLLAEAVFSHTISEKLRIVMTLRSDYETQIRDLNKNKYENTDWHKNWQENWQNRQFFVTPMNREELQQIIEEPAEQRTLVFESPRLVNKLIDEVIGMQGALPLLSFALSELYSKYLKAEEDNVRKDRIITDLDYEELGGVTRSITKRANEVYDNLVGKNLACKIDRESDKSAAPKSAYEDTVRRVMLRMVSLQGGELAKRQVPKSELVYASEQENERVKTVIKSFSEARLIVAGSNSQGKAYVEPAHDALVSGWDKLLAWSQQEKENLILQRRLTSEAVKWEREASKPQQLSNFQRIVKPAVYWLDRKLNVVENIFDKINPRIDNYVLRLWDGEPNKSETNIIKPSQYLWDGDAYLDVLDKTLNSDDNWLNQVEEEFIKKSIDRKQRNHKWRWRITGSVSLVITITAIIASIQWINAQRRLISTIDALTEASQQLFDSNQEFDALLTSIRAGKQAKQVAFGVTPEIEYRIKTQLQQSLYWGKELNRLESHEAKVFSVSLSSDGQLLASGSADATIKLWDVNNGKQFKTLSGHTDAVHVVSFSPDGTLLASASDSDQTVKLWDVATGKEISSFDGYDSDDNGNKGISFSPDGRFLAYASDKNIKIRTYATGTVRSPFSSTHVLNQKNPFHQLLLELVTKLMMYFIVQNFMRKLI